MQLTPTDWLTLALVVVTTFYAWATFRILKANESVVAAMREQTEAQLRPYVVVAAAPRIGTTLLCLEVRNAGKSPALNLRMTLDRPFYANGEKRPGKNIAELPAFTAPIESLPPDAKLIFILGVGGTIFGAGSDAEVCPPKFRVQTTYEHGTRSYSEDNIIDIRPMLNSSVYHDTIADEIKSLRESLEKLAAVDEQA